MQLSEMECPNCGAPVTDVENHHIQCYYCGTVLNLHQSLCPYCNLINPQGSSFCIQCGEAIVRVCPACNHENWAGAEHCAKCGRVLDLLEIITKSRIRDTRARLEHQQREALGLKIREAAQAEARMKQFWAVEHERQTEIARRTEELHKRERLILGGIVLGVLAVILLLIVVSLIGPL